MKNKFKILVLSFVFSLVSGVFLLSISLRSSFSIKNFKDVLISETIKADKNLFFSMKLNKVDDNIDSQIKTIESKYYSYFSASFFTPSIDLIVNSGTKEAKYDLSILSSESKRFDNSSYITQGYVPVISSETTSFSDSYSSKYYFLNNTDDAIYLPDCVADMIVKDFGFSGYDDIIFSESSSKFKGKVNCVFKYGEFDSECKIRGVFNYKDACKTITFLENSNLNLSFCSRDIFSNIHCRNELLVEIRNNKNILSKNSSINQCFNILSNIENRSKAKIAFTYAFDENCKTILIENYNIYVLENEKVSTKKRIVSIAICCFIFLLIVCMFIYFRKDIGLFVAARFCAIYLLTILLFYVVDKYLIKSKSYTIISNNGLFFTTLIFALTFFLLIFLGLLPYLKKEKYFYEEDI